MAKGDNLGEFEILVLAALLRLGDQAYGVAIRRELEEQAQRQVSIGAVYATLERLEGKALVCARMGEASPERGGRAKRYFHIEAEGERRLKASLETMRRMTDGIVDW